MHDLISIIVPVYNKEKYIEKCINSIISQTYNNLEIIIVDDGSSDNSLKICKKIAKNNINIKVIQKNNGGVSSARNVGINNANGKYISFIDIDDIVENNMIEILYNNLINNKSQLSICSYYVNPLNKKVDNEININFNKEEFYKNINIYKGFCWNKLFILDKVKKVYFDETLHYCEDLLFCVKYVEMINNISYTNLKLYNYVQNSDSAISQKWNERKATVIDAYKKIFDIIKKYDFNIIKEFYIGYFNILNDVTHFYDKINKIELKKIYCLLQKNKLSLKQRANLFIRYHLFGLYNIIRLIYHKIRG